jgi:hypothetical protein
VIEAPRGAGFTGIYPDYPVDHDAAEAYRDNAADRAWLSDFVAGLASPASVGSL